MLFNLKTNKWNVKGFSHIDYEKVNLLTAVKTSHINFSEVLFQLNLADMSTEKKKS